MTIYFYLTAGLPVSKDGTPPLADVNTVYITAGFPPEEDEYVLETNKFYFSAGLPIPKNGENPTASTIYITAGLPPKAPAVTKYLALTGENKFLLLRGGF